MKRTLWVITYVAATVALLLMLRQVVLLGFFVTLPWFGALRRLEPLLLRETVFAVLFVVAPSVGVACTHLRRIGRYDAARRLLQAALAIAALALSYRFPALVMATLLLGVALVVRFRRLSWVLCMSTLLLCLLPWDISLQRFPSAPHFAYGGSGMATGSPTESEKRGESVRVGFCEPWYNQPSFVWVW